MYTCPNCSAPVVYGQSACGNCGVALDWGAVQQTSAQNRRRKANQHQQQNMYGKIMAMLKKKHLSGIMLPITAVIFIAIVGGIIFFALNSDSLFNSSNEPSEGQTTASTSTEFKKPPSIKSFSAEPKKIIQGQKAELSWDVSGATSVSIDQGIGTVPSSGTQEVTPDITTTYHLTATNSAGPVSESVVITVNEPPEPAITSFTASLNSINAGDSVTLEWKIARASYVNIDQGIGIVTSSGSKVVTPTKTTTYTITAKNADGTVSKSVTITVAASGLPVITSFTATPSTITVSDNSTLVWDVSGATSISINQNIGNVLESGNKRVSPAETTTYIITARNNAGTVTAEATVAVTSDEPEINSFTASPTNIYSDEFSTLYWDISGASTASITNSSSTDNVSVTAISGSKTVYPTITTIYTLTATNGYGSDTKTATVTVTSASPPEITSFTADPETITLGSSSILSWSFTGATSASIDHDVGDLSAYALSKQVTVYPDETTIYTLTVTNSNGDDTATVTVTVTVNP